VAIINNILALKVVFLNLITLHSINEVGGSCGTHGRVEKLYTVFVGNPEGKRPLGRPKHRWDDRIRVDLREIGWECRVDAVGSR
jgi:hypothetical protein